MCLPKGFFKVRYYGIFTNVHRKANIAIAKAFLWEEQQEEKRETIEDGRRSLEKQDTVWGVSGKFAYEILIGLNIEISFIFAIAGIAFAKCFVSVSHNNFWIPYFLCGILLGVRYGKGAKQNQNHRVEFML